MLDLAERLIGDTPTAENALNAGAAIYAAGLTDTLGDGIGRAAQVLASGAARAKLDALIAFG